MNANHQPSIKPTTGLLASLIADAFAAFAEVRRVAGLFRSANRAAKKAQRKRVWCDYRAAQHRAAAEARESADQAAYEALHEARAADDHVVTHVVSQASERLPPPPSFIVPARRRLSERV